MAIFLVFLTTVAYIFGEASGYGLSYAGIALIIAGLMSFGSYYWGDKLILRLHKAQEIKKEDNPRLHNLVENLSLGAGLDKPKIYLIPDSSPNALATGRDPKHAVVAVTKGLLEKLDKLELEGVLAHELSHIKNFDTRLLAITAVLVGSVAILADFFMRSLWYGGRSGRRGGGILVFFGVLAAILAPIVATLIQLAVSRRREFLADASAALLTRYPEGLASALEKIAATAVPMRTASSATAHLYIANPFKKNNARFWLSGWFETHPPIEERVAALRAM